MHLFDRLINSVTQTMSGSGESPGSVIIKNKNERTTCQVIYVVTGKRALSHLQKRQWESTLVYVRAVLEHRISLCYQAKCGTYTAHMRRLAEHEVRGAIGQAGLFLPMRRDAANMESSW